MQPRYICLFHLVLTIVGFVSIPSVSSADVTLHITSPRGAGKILVKNGMIRMFGSNGQGDAAGEMIFKGQKEGIIVVDASRKEATVMTEADFQKMGQRLGNIMARMQEQMQHMSAEQREKMQQMMGVKMPSQGQQQEASLQVTQTGKTKKLLGTECAQYLVTRNGEISFEYWIAPKSSIDGGEEAVRAFASMGNFFSNLFETLHETPLQSMLNNPYAAMGQIDGVPLETIQYKNGSKGSSTLITRITQGSVPEGLFRIPEGYKVTRPADQL